MDSVRKLSRGLLGAPGSVETAVMALKRRDHDFTTGSSPPASQSCHDIFDLVAETG